ncbi:hypothetical protein CEP54_004923 [Fusarium duplospermum]|uniref:Uncharacterized protein n=1 Tax=Fusarium duplospermum TaxID=1325734 RepID=A0A428QFK7_9HYPO|nr:hypothetical protein CEP54_004923 [Fusarium duplospermum]
MNEEINERRPDDTLDLLLIVEAQILPEATNSPHCTSQRCTPTYHKNLPLLVYEPRATRPTNPFLYGAF